LSAALVGKGFFGNAQKTGGADFIFEAAVRFDCRRDSRNEMKGARQ
jgi:hypothetical protein